MFQGECGTEKRGEQMKTQIPLPRKSTYDEGSENPCVVCGKKIKKTRFMVHIVEGGGILQKIGVPYEDEASDLGMHPIGSTCIKLIPKEFYYKLNVVELKAVNA